MWNIHVERMFENYFKATMTYHLMTMNNNTFSWNTKNTVSSSVSIDFLFRSRRIIFFFLFFFLSFWYQALWLVICEYRVYRASRLWCIACLTIANQVSSRCLTDMIVYDKLQIMLSDLCRWMWKFNEPNEHWTSSICYMYTVVAVVVAIHTFISMKSNIIR